MAWNPLPNIRKPHEKPCFSIGSMESMDFGLLFVGKSTKSGATKVYSADKSPLQLPRSGISSINLLKRLLRCQGTSAAKYLERWKPCRSLKCRQLFPSFDTSELTRDFIKIHATLGHVATQVKLWPVQPHNQVLQI